MIECQDVSFSYPASTLPDSERQAGGALKHISCTIEDGSFVLLCGTSGCGKTTMTRLFNGLIPHYHEGTYTGSVYLDGKDTRDLSLFDISLALCLSSVLILSRISSRTLSVKSWWFTSCMTI